MVIIIIGRCGGPPRMTDYTAVRCTSTGDYGSLTFKDP